MGAMMEKIVRANLLRNADYETFQLIKSGRLATAANKVLTSRRRFLTFQHISFVGVTLLGMAVLGIQTGTQNSVGATCGLIWLISITQLASLFAWRSSLERLETMLYLWLQETQESDDVDRSELEALLIAVANRF